MTPTIRIRESGLTMVELLVALAVGLFLTAGIIQLLVSSSQTARSVDASSFIQENARFALATLAHDIRMAGFLGCRSLNDGGVPIMSSSPSFDADVPTDDAGRPLGIFALSSNTTPDWSLGSIQRVSGSDLIQVVSAQGVGATLSSSLASGGDALVLAENPDGLKARDVAVITDCQDASVFTVTSVTGSTVEHTGLGKTYLAGARIFPLVANAYVVGTRPNSPCARQSCLYKFPLGRRDSSNGVIPAQDLVAVEDLQLRFGVDSGGGVVYAEADAVANWSAVHSVRIGLLVGSDASDPDRGNVTAAPQKYVFQDPADQDLNEEPTVTTATDRRLRIPYWATVTLRNSLP